MTSGSSQGLFVIVAVVIFGIFVVISYLLFRDKMQIGLANIFNDSISESKDNVDSFVEVKEFKTSLSDITYIDNNGDYVFNYKGKSTLTYPVGIINDIPSGIIIPWGYKMVFTYDIYYESSTDAELIASADLNSYPITGTAWQGNDNFGTSSIKDSTNPFTLSKLKANEWNTVEFWFANDSEKNINKVDIEDRIVRSSLSSTVFGIQQKSLSDNNITTFKMRNIKYKIVKI